MMSSDYMCIGDGSKVGPYSYTVSVGFTRCVKILDDKKLQILNLFGKKPIKEYTGNSDIEFNCVENVKYDITCETPRPKGTWPY